MATRILKQCAHCGKDVLILKNKISANNFCDKKCYTDWRKNSFKSIPCDNCGDYFIENNSKVKQGKNHFCKLSCRKEFFSQKIYKCDQCGGDMKRSPSSMSRHKNNFCKKECQAAWYKKHSPLIGTKQSEERKHAASVARIGKNTGSNSPSWKGSGDTPRQIRDCSKYIDWRQKVFIKDDFTCSECNQRGGRLEAHHLKSFSILLKESRAALPLLSPYDSAISYTPLWDIENGKTLCVECHDKLHKKKASI